MIVTFQNPIHKILQTGRLDMGEGFHFGQQLLGLVDQSVQREQEHFRVDVPHFGEFALGLENCEKFVVN